MGKQTKEKKVKGKDGKWYKQEISVVLVPTTPPAKKAQTAAQKSATDKLKADNQKIKARFDSPKNKNASGEHVKTYEQIRKEYYEK